MNRRDEFLKTQKILRLATIGKYKTPHIVPVWYMYNSKKIFIGTNTRTQKAKNLKKNSRVSFCVWSKGGRKGKPNFR
jgi:nitroimidazol reductase NimA-like FMN-containing flavoprotein (pyridoxamine 5'-phosphate oxidase superfamily)